MDQDEVRKKRMRLFGPSDALPSFDNNNTNHATGGPLDMSDAHRTGELTDNTPEAQAVRAMVASLSCAKCKALLQSSSAIMWHFHAVYQNDQYTQPTLHCQEAHGVEVLILLCGFDSTTKHNKVAKRAPIPQNVPSKSSAASALANMMRGPTSSSSNGTGYGGGMANDEYDDDDGWNAYAGKGQRLGAYNIEDKSSATTQSLEHGDDRLAAGIMAALATLLEDPSPCQALPELLYRSSILDRAADLLVNTSVDDIIKRAGLYLQLATFMHRLAAYPTTAAVLYTPRATIKAGHNILRVVTGLPTLTLADTKEKAQPLAQCMTGLDRQSMMMAKNAQMLNDDSINTLCIAIQGAYDAVVKANLASLAPAEPAAEPGPDAVSDVPDYAVLRDYSLKNAANGLGKMVAPNRMKRITKEIIELSQNLPDGIFVRYGNGRPDLMKVLIVAPKGGPYENGLFEFDLLCPNNYPQDPPMMRFRTTGGGTFYFNPNLYADGKVCLSLLGTWSGPKWKPGESTIYQVLVSIQAFIFCDEPWCNEPGREGLEGSAQSKAYNRTLQPKTVELAMLGWLQGKSDSIWRDVVVKHFQQNQDDILETIGKWKDDKPSPNRTQSKKREAKKPGWISPLFKNSSQGSGQTLGNVPATPQMEDEEEIIDDDDDDEMDAMDNFPPPPTAPAPPKPKSKSKWKPKFKNAGKSFGTGHTLGGGGIDFGGQSTPSSSTSSQPSTQPYGFPYGAIYPPGTAQSTGPFGGLVNPSTFNQPMGYQPSPLSQSFLPPASAYPPQPPAIPGILSTYQGTGWTGKKSGGEDDEKQEEEQEQDEEGDDVVFVSEKKVEQEAVAQEAPQNEGAQEEVISELADFAAKLREAVKELNNPARLTAHGYGVDGDWDLDI